MNSRARNYARLIPGILVAISVEAVAGLPTGLDTIRTYQMEEVVVTATRSPLSKSRSPSRISLISRESMDLANGTSLGALIRNTTGVLVREYGTGGALQTASFRGMASEQTLVLLDDVPINNVQTGLADLCLIPIDQIERIELARGGGSALYGANALGGVVNILTVAPSTTPTISLDASAGSFGASRFALRSTLAPGEEWRLSIGGSTETGSGNYPFILRQGRLETEAIRTNSDHRARDLFLKSDWHPAAGQRAELLLSYASLDRGTPGPLLTVSSQGSARQADEQFQAVGSLSTGIGDRIRLRVSGNVQDAYERYAEFLGLFPADNYYRNVTFGFRPQLRYELSRSAAMILGLELGRAIAAGNALDEDKSQFHSALSVASEISTDTLAHNLSVSFFPSVRYDRFTGVQDSWSPKFGLNLRALPGQNGREDQYRVTLHSTIGRDFRPPTFNELYYAGAGGHGNRTLLPERSLSLDAGLTMDFSWAGDQEFDATYYSITANDRIFWQPAASQFDWSPVNIGETTSAGLEVDYRWSLPGRWVEFTGNYALLNARKKTSSGPGDPTFDKQLIYVPLETGGIGAVLRIPINDPTLRGFHLRVAEEYVGDRFIVEDNTIALPGYFLLSGNLGIEARLGNDVLVQLKYELNNLANQGYEVMPRYPMPLRNHNLSISLTRAE